MHRSVKINVPLNSGMQSISKILRVTNTRRQRILRLLHFNVFNPSGPHGSVLRRVFGTIRATKNFMPRSDDTNGFERF